MPIKKLPYDRLEPLVRDNLGEEWEDIRASGRQFTVEPANGQGTMCSRDTLEGQASTP